MFNNKKKSIGLDNFLKLRTCCKESTVEPRYNEDLRTMKITLLYQVSHYIRVKKQRNIKSWDQLNHLVIKRALLIRPLYNEVPLYFHGFIAWKLCAVRPKKGCPMST